MPIHNIPVVVDMKNHEHWYNINFWLVENIGKECYSVDYISFSVDNRPYNKRVWFATETDAMLFLLRWGE